jgi:hypothetical protein
MGAGWMVWLDGWLFCGADFLIWEIRFIFWFFLWFFSLLYSILPLLKGAFLLFAVWKNLDFSFRNLKITKSVIIWIFYVIKCIFEYQNCIRNYQVDSVRLVALNSQPEISQHLISIDSHYVAILRYLMYRKKGLFWTNLYFFIEF